MPIDTAPVRLTGTPSQIEWAELIKPRVGAEFDRVAAALTGAGATRSDHVRADARAAVAILEDKRAEVMANASAGYFIRDWQELNGQVRRLIVQDPRYRAIQASKVAR